METDKPFLTPNNSESLRNSFSEHGNEIEEVISKKPPFIVRWGTMFLFLLLIFIGIVSWFVKYPDIVLSSAILSSINPPKTVITNSSGKLIKLFVKENDTVSKGQIIGYVEATANHEEILELSEKLTRIQTLLDHNNSELIQTELSYSFNNLGELQNDYQTFATAFLNFKNYLSNGFYLRKKNMLVADMSNYKRLHNNLDEQKSLHEQDLLLSQKNFDANQSLNNDNVIADVEFRNEGSKLIGKKLLLPQITSSIISNEALQNEKQKEIAELENTIAQQKAIFIQALNTFKSQIDDWKKKYLLIAPISGKISFATFVQENQQLQENQIICFVNPQNTEYYAQINIPQANFGKVALGQTVLLKFPSYPYQEYGAIKGKIDFISHIPTDSGYLAKVILTNGLNTNYSKVVQYTEGLRAQGEIVTKDLRLFQRFYYNLLGQMRNN